MSEIPFDARFKTFVKQKKNKEQANLNGVVPNIAPVTSVDRYDKQLPPPPVDSEDTENETTTNLLSEYYADQSAVVPNGGRAEGGGVDSDTNNQIETNFADRGAVPNDRLSGVGMNGSRANHRQNGSSPNVNITTEHNEDGDYDICEENNNNRNHRDHDIRPIGRRKHNPNDDNEDESDDSVDEDEEDAEEGVYDLGTSNLFLD